jgi:hypothetical protein
MQNAVTVAQVEADPTKTIEAITADAQTFLNRWREVEHGTDMRKIRLKREGLRQRVKVPPLYVGKASCVLALAYFGEIEILPNWPIVEADLNRALELLRAIESQVPNQ